MRHEIKSLVQYLQTLNPDDIADYATLSEKAGVDLVKKRHILIQALQTAERDYHLLFQNIRSIGYKRLDNAVIPHQVTLIQSAKIRARTGRWREIIHNSGTADSKPGLQSLTQCAFVEFAVDVDTQKKIATVTQEQAMNLQKFKDTKNKLFALFAEKEPL